jgi:hypothetical protein
MNFTSLVGKLIHSALAHFSAVFYVFHFLWNDLSVSLNRLKHFIYGKMPCLIGGRCIFMTGSSPALEVRISGISGNGVYALTSIPKGVLVTTCAGKIYSTRDCPTTHHALQIGEDLWLWSDGSNLDDNINHSCEPNVGFTGEGLELYSLRTIATGEEICWDYSTSLIEEDWSLECRCGTKTCRRLILPFFALSPSIQERLLPISLGFIRRLHEKASL